MPAILYCGHKEEILDARRGAWILLFFSSLYLILYVEKRARLVNQAVVSVTVTQRQTPSSFFLLLQISKAELLYLTL